MGSYSTNIWFVTLRSTYTTSITCCGSLWYVFVRQSEIVAVAALVLSSTHHGSTRVSPPRVQRKISPRHTGTLCLCYDPATPRSHARCSSRMVGHAGHAGSCSSLVPSEHVSAARIHSGTIAGDSTLAGDCTVAGETVIFVLFRSNEKRGK